MDYKQLKKFLSNNTEYNLQFEKRFDGFGVFITELYPYLLKRNKTQRSTNPLFVVPLKEIQLLIQQIGEYSIQIKNISKKLPGVATDQFYKEQLYKAIISSNEIEGIKTERKEVSEAYESVITNNPKRTRLKSTLYLYRDIMYSEKIDIHELNDIRKLYDQLTEGEIESNEKPNGNLFREKIEGKIIMVGNHLPPETELEITSQLSKWIDFINDHSFPYIVRAIIGHYFFENTHPFNDGNGRIGRYIFSRYLSKKLDAFSGLVISQKINENKYEYYKAFEITGDSYNKAEATFFMLSMLRYISEGQKEIIGILEGKSKKLDVVIEWLKNNNYSDEENYVLFLLYQSQLFTDYKDDGIQDNTISKEAKEETTFSMRSIKRALEKLEDADIITLSTKRPKRHIIKTPIV